MWLVTTVFDSTALDTHEKENIWFKDNTPLCNLY